MELSFNDLPRGIHEINERLTAIESLLLTKTNDTQPVDEWFDVRQLCTYLPDKPVRATVYAWTQSKSIPYHKKSKKLSFNKNEIDLWIKEGRHKTTKEIEQQADDYISKKRKGNNNG
jgi:hypothetical protein